MIVAGIDPGKTGALAVLFPDGSAMFGDVPSMKLRNRDRPAWSQWWAEWTSILRMASPDKIVIEDVASRPGQGVSSMFSFGRSFGFAHGIAASCQCPVYLVSPGTWKAKLGLINSDKNASRELCRSLYPAVSDHVRRTKDDGRAEALLLAHYGRKHL